MKSDVTHHEDYGSNFPGKIAAVVMRLSLVEGEKYLYVSPNVYQYLGYRHTNFESGEKTIWDFIPPEHAKPVMARWESALESGEEFESQFPLIHRTGISTWVHFNAVFTRALDRVFLADCMIMRLDAMRRHELEKGTSSTLLKSIINTTPSLIFAKDLNGRFLFANKSMTQHYNLDIEQIKGKSDLDIIPNQPYAEHYREEDRSVISQGKSMLFHSKIESAEGTRFFQTIKSPLCDPSGEVIGIVGIAADVTNHVLTQQKLQENEERQALVNDFSRSLFGLLDEEEVIWHLINKFLAKFSFEDCVYYKYDSADKVLIQNTGCWDGKYYRHHENPFIIEIGKGVIGQAALRRTSLVIHDTSKDPYYIAYTPDRKSELAIPLIIGEELLGIMNFETTRPAYFEETLVNTLETICNLASLKVAEARAIAQLNESRKGLDEILNAPEELIVLSLDRNLRYVAFNNKHKQNMRLLYGVEIEIGMCILDCITHEEDKMQFEQNGRRALNGEQFLLTEQYGEDERYRAHWEVQYYPRRNATGEVTGLINFVRDVSAQVRTHQKAVENEQKLSTIFNATNELMALLGNDKGTLRFLGVNKAFLDFFSCLGTNLSEESLLGRDYGPLIMRSGFFQEDREGEYRDFVKDILTRTDAVSCIQQVKIEGKKRYLDIYYKPVRDKNQQTLQVIVSAKEITDLVEANDQLREREHLLDSINRNMKDGIYRSTIDDNLLYHNRAMYEMFGYTEEDAKTLHPSEYYVNLSDREQIIGELRNTGRIANKEVLFKRKNGEQFWGMVNSTLRTDRSGQPVIDGIVIDISNIKAFQEELETNNDALKKTNSELDHLVYRTSHDLRAPIASLIGLTELIKMEQTAGASREYLGMMEEQLHKLDGIIMDIINYRKIAKTGLQYSKLDLQTLIHDVLNGMKFTESYHRIKKRIKGNWEVPFYSDLHNVSIILNNLLSNAIKYSDSNKPESRFDLVLDITDERAVFTLSDNGIGVDKEYQTRVFDMFFRATVERTGTGLGLFIVKEAVDKLGGHIAMESVPKEGTTFVLTLPNKQTLVVSQN